MTWASLLVWSTRWFWLFWGFIFVALLFSMPWALGKRRLLRPAERVLRDRFARGEITEEEYEEKMDELNRKAA